MAACISCDFNPVGSCKKSTSIQPTFNVSKLSETLLINPAGEKSYVSASGLSAFNFPALVLIKGVFPFQVYKAFPNIDSASAYAGEVSK